MQDNMKHKNIHIIGILKGEEEDEGIENLLIKITAYLSNLVRKMQVLACSGSTEGHDQYECKAAHSKAHHN